MGSGQGGQLRVLPFSAERLCRDGLLGGEVRLAVVAWRGGAYLKGIPDGISGKALDMWVCR